MSIMWHCIKFCSPDLHSFPSPQWITVAARGKSYRPWHILTLQQISGWGQHVPQNEPQTPQRKWNVWNMFESPQQYLTTVQHRADWADHGAKMSKVEEPLDWILWRWRRTKPCFNIFQHLSTETADWLLYSWLCWLLYSVNVLFYFILISVWWISMWEFSAWSRLSRLTESHWISLRPGTDADALPSEVWHISEVLCQSPSARQRKLLDVPGRAGAVSKKGNEQISKIEIQNRIFYICFYMFSYVFEMQQWKIEVVHQRMIKWMLC